MSLTKFATVEVQEVLDVKGAATQQRTASLDKVSDFHDYRTEDGYLYARIRAISSRVNKNNDGWPSIELAGGQDIFDRHVSSEGGFTVEASDGADTGFSTFLGKPIFVDHNNSDPTRARGVIVDAKLHVEDHKTAAELDPYYSDAPDNHTPPTWVELLLEVDAKSFPKLAAAIVKGADDPNDGIDGFSMGCDVDHTKCNICHKEASSPDDYCDHVRMKGAEFPVHDEHGIKIGSKKAYEDCFGIKFFEISAVFDPADETALIKEVRHESKVASQKLADNPEPQSTLTTAPDPVNTLREEKNCEVCGSTMDTETCDVCGYTEPPDGLNNPDLQRAQQQGLTEDIDPNAQQQVVPGQETVPTQDARIPTPTAGVTNEMAWQASVNSRLAGRINPVETPVKPDSTPATNEPVEQTLTDPATPVTSRTASDFVSAANQENRMAENDETRVAAEPADPSGKADKQVDVNGVGGVQDASNDQASKADKQVDVLGKGGTGVEDVSADEHQSIEETSDNAGFDKGKRTQDSGPTKTFPNKGQASPVSDKAFPTSAKKGVDPVDKSGKPDERVNVEEQVNVSWNQSDSGTDQWTGTGGNGVTRQQNPVTPKVDPNITVSKRLVDIMKLADLEVAMDLIEPSAKYARIAELEQESDETIKAQRETLSKVRTAGLKKATSAPRQATRLPSFSQPTSDTSKTASAEPEVPQEIEDAAVFTR